MEENEKTLAETVSGFLDLAKRHKFYFLIPFISIGIITTIIAMKLPLAYVSKGTILIEQQQIPQTMIQTTVTGFADERIRFIQQRVMTRDRIISIIDKYNLYKKEKDKLLTSELIQQFENDVTVDLIAADVKSGQSGAGKATIAFTIAYRSQDRAMAQVIATELVNLFLAENSRVRTQRATKTTEFISEEADKMNREIQVMENKIAEFKEKYGRSLPELLPTNLSAVERISGELRQTDNQINLLKDRIAYLAAALPRVRPEYSAPMQRDEKNPLSKDEQLRSLKAEYVRLTSRYNPSHPDVLRVERQIKMLDPAFSGVLDTQEVAGELDKTRQDLGVLEKKYAANHPDVVKLKQKANLLEQQPTSKPADSNPVSEASAGPHDPAYINLLGQLKSSQSELEAQIKWRGEQQKNLEQLDNIIAQTPQVERGYRELVRERETSLTKFAELKAKAQQAKLAQTLEEEQKGESFTLIEPPVLPDTPEKGARQKFAVMGLAAGFFIGVGLVVLAEALDSSVRGQRSLQAITGIAPMIVIPYIENDDDIRRKRRRVKLMWIASLVSVVVTILLVHFLVMPLDDVWQRILWRLQ